MTVKEGIEAKLQIGLAPVFLEVLDESASHAGHLEAGHGGETHFRVRVTSSAFADRSRIERHRLVNRLLAEDLANGVHALAIEARAPGE